MKFTLVQLKHTILVAKFGSFSEAARQSNVAQSTISNYVSDLEESLGKPLFSRSTRKVELTAFGNAMMPLINDTLVSAERVAKEAQAYLVPEKKLLRIAYTPLLDIKTIDALCTAYRQANPDVEIFFKECDVEGLENRLKEEQIDVICGPNISSKNERKRCLLFHDPLHYIPPSADTSLFEKTITPNKIAKQTLLLTVGACGLAPATQDLFKKAQLNPTIYPGRAHTHGGLFEWAELGMGGAVLPASRISGDAAQYPKVTLEDKTVDLSYEAVWLKSSESVPHLRDFFWSLPKVAEMITKETAEWH